MTDDVVTLLDKLSKSIIVEPDRTPTRITGKRLEDFFKFHLMMMNDAPTMLRDFKSMWPNGVLLDEKN